jgi:hypothetical protein
VHCTIHDPIRPFPQKAQKHILVFEHDPAQLTRRPHIHKSRPVFRAEVSVFRETSATPWAKAFHKDLQEEEWKSKITLF